MMFMQKYEQRMMPLYIVEKVLFFAAFFITGFIHIFDNDIYIKEIFSTKYLFFYPLITLLLRTYNQLKKLSVYLFNNKTNEVKILVCQVKIM